MQQGIKKFKFACILIACAGLFVTAGCTEDAIVEGGTGGSGKGGDIGGSGYRIASSDSSGMQVYYDSVEIDEAMWARIDHTEAFDNISLPSHEHATHADMPPQRAFIVGDEVVLDDDHACVTNIFADHMVLDYKDGFTSYEEIFYVNDDYARTEFATDKLKDCEPNTYSIGGNLTGLSSGSPSVFSAITGEGTLMDDRGNYYMTAQYSGLGNTDAERIEVLKAMASNDSAAVGIHYNPNDHRGAVLYDSKLFSGDWPPAPPSGAAPNWHEPKSLSTCNSTASSTWCGYGHPQNVASVALGKGWNTWQAYAINAPINTFSALTGEGTLMDDRGNYYMTAQYSGLGSTDAERIEVLKAMASNDSAAVGIHYNPNDLRGAVLYDSKLFSGDWPPAPPSGAVSNWHAPTSLSTCNSAASSTWCGYGHPQDVASVSLGKGWNTWQAYAINTENNLIGHSAGQLTLQNNDGDDLTLSTDGSFTFSTAINDLSGYTVSVSSQPDGQHCDIENATGTVNGMSVTNVSVVCKDDFEEIIFEDPNLQACFESAAAAHGWKSIDDVRSLSCPNYGITSAYGIHQLTALTYVDLSDNSLTSIDLAANTALTTLDLRLNNLTSINLTANTALTSLYLRNNFLSDINLTANTALTHLSLRFNNLTSIDLATNTALTSLDLNRNQLSDINLTANTALTTLHLSYNNLHDINLTANTELTYLNLRSNNLTSIDLSTNTALTTLYLQKNNLASIDLSTNTALTSVNLGSNNLSSIDLTNNTALTTLVFNQNNLNNIDLAANTELTFLDLSWNNLTEIDLATNTALKDLWLCVNNLSSVDLTNNTKLSFPRYSFRHNVRITENPTLDQTTKDFLDDLKLTGAYVIY